ncbi:MAG: hypothetical protein IPN32_38670 [Deltaproteobacteria bacterium]|nr:hypothetical protein [Deltaproteobacteria bacterium]
MPYGSGIEREVLYQNESTFATLPAAWSSGTPFLCIDPTSEAMQQATIENMNYRQRALATRGKVLSLANGTCGFKIYPHGRSTAVAEGARSTITTPNFPIAHFMQNAWGGIRLGYCSGLDGSGTQAAPALDTGQGTNWAAGDWAFFVDDTTGEGEFRKILSISTDTLTLWDGHDLSFSPASADTAAAVIQAYPHTSVLVNPNHASHLTQSFLFIGDLSDDAQQGVGVKLNLSGIEGIAPGEAAALVFEGLVTQIDNEAVSQPSAGTPLGDAPLVVSTGDDTTVWISAVGDALAAVEAQSISVTPGIASQPITGPGGLEGRHGYNLAQGSADAAMIEVAVDYDDAWNTAFAAGTRYQILIQVGTEPGRAWGLAALNCELAEDPQRGVTTDNTTSVLKFRPLESDVSTAATGTDLEKVRAKIEILFSCALA